MRRAESRRSSKHRASIVLSPWSQDAFQLWCVAILTEYCQPGKLTWALVFRNIVGAYLHRRNYWLPKWLISVSRLTNTTWLKAPTLSPSVGLSALARPCCKTIQVWLTPTWNHIIRLTIMSQDIQAKEKHMDYLSEAGQRAGFTWGKAKFFTKYMG